MEKTSLLVNSRHVGSMDHPVWWDKEMVAADRMEYSLAAILFEVGKCAYFKIVTCIIEMMY
jgi:hypothetical protein